jgi:hypothetical protein
MGIMGPRRQLLLAGLRPLTFCRGTGGLLIAALMIGCATEPSLVGHVFVLESIGGQPVPAPVFPASSLKVTGDTVTIGAAPLSLGLRLFHREWYATSAGLQQQVYAESYHMVGDTLVFEQPPCPPGADCAWMPHWAIVDGGRLTINFVSSSFLPMSYRMTR